jgi:hypothetical protein
VPAALKERAMQIPPQSKPDCCVQKSLYWDEVISYLARTH